MSSIYVARGWSERSRSVGGLMLPAKLGTRSLCPREEIFLVLALAMELKMVMFDHGTQRTTPYFATPDGLPLPL